MDDSEHWIDRALRNHKKKATHKMLGLPLEQPLPLYLLEEIKQAPIGALVRYSYMGKFGVVRRLYTVTLLMKRRVGLALTLIKFGHKRSVLKRAA